MRMFKNDLNLEMTKGDTFCFGVSIIDLGQELDHIEGNDYFYKVRIAPNDTKDLEPKKYYYDFEINVNEDTFTLLKGILDIEFDVRG